MIQTRAKRLPVSQLKNFAWRGGARRATQWYWPPEIGYLFAKFSIRDIIADRPSYIDAISAMDAQVANAPTKAKM
jgi:hypothetical protein